MSKLNRRGLLGLLGFTAASAAVPKVQAQPPASVAPKPPTEKIICRGDSLTRTADSNYAMVFTDAAGNTIYGVRTDGTIHVARRA